MLQKIKTRIQKLQDLQWKRWDAKRAEEISFLARTVWELETRR